MDVPREADGTGEANRAIEACLLPKSGTGDADRMDGVEIGTDLGGFNDEPSPLSAMLARRFQESLR